MTDYPVRLDVFLFENGYANSRSKAAMMIKSGAVYVDKKVIKKAGFLLEKPCEIVCDASAADELKYVSRGGLKLEKAIEVFGIDLSNMICADIGASTGGFCDCMLQNGAVKVYAVDVGTSQLAQKLIDDTRVINLEKTNFRYCTHDLIPDEIDFASVDVSFISLEKILLPLYNLMKNGAFSVCLIKPQFEAGKDNVGKNGVVRDISVHIAIIEKIIALSTKIGFSVLGLDFSPIKGPQGNIEYLIYLKKDNSKDSHTKINIQSFVENSHKILSE